MYHQPQPYFIETPGVRVHLVPALPPDHPATELPFPVCAVCEVPAAISVRTVPCYHLMCKTCGEEAMTAGCPRCKCPVSSIDHLHPLELKLLRICPNAHCQRAFLDQRSLNTHVFLNHRLVQLSEGAKEQVRCLQKGGARQWKETPKLPVGGKGMLGPPLQAPVRQVQPKAGEALSKTGTWPGQEPLYGSDVLTTSHLSGKRPFPAAAPGDLRGLVPEPKRERGAPAPPPPPGIPPVAGAQGLAGYARGPLSGRQEREDEEQELGDTGSAKFSEMSQISDDEDEESLDDLSPAPTPPNEKKEKEKEEAAPAPPKQPVAAQAPVPVPAPVQVQAAPPSSPQPRSVAAKSKPLPKKSGTPPRQAASGAAGSGNPPQDFLQDDFGL
uniref:RING-type domain-containing protein n=1 Tax=Chromera velia CCMP2878 TaxID=1169474 RepID=A0A0G4EZT3_9ALVE|mmetsp:Transcript_47205/g.93117  ORF Transcript_47205/g.93117 Transcript_47205/m.93117 type:complete len:383 (-) Transcript_47205:86-1234(-)|eukprot:Cvel_14487.t1-p1 / transcript=Cvel_14487.t1 / gene=Cvel_14487 / organism=Chromera_velia_CCMP2878 / gene_product=E3 ubiquitin-protein ligase ZNF645, putative / transcript_product=E3 ubiquitin-protein ligase ZNF645, putative / location=Cvel_scaffold1032:50357-53272(-) / protein_length=382 / sequence_SO=supercontig / SO=protein_coding / is_pseudo=false